jgi:hypothetical protein
MDPLTDGQPERRCAHVQILRDYVGDWRRCFRCGRHLVVPRGLQVEHQRREFDDDAPDV